MNQRRFSLRRRLRAESLRRASRSPSADPLTEDHRTRALRAIPSNIVVAWAFLDGLLRANPHHVPLPLQWGVLVVVLGLTPLWAWRSSDARPPSLREAAAATLAFAVWAFALGGPFEQFAWYTPTLAAVVLSLYTLAAPLLLGPHPAR